MIELKPCPFCGGEAELDATGDSNFSMIYNGYASVKCNSCDIETPWFETEPMVSIDDCNAESDRVIQCAISFWNNRPRENKIRSKAVESYHQDLLKATKFIFHPHFEGVKAVWLSKLEKDEL